ncbi:hydroxyacylglutathione hydrolase [Acidithiobacillus sp. AMEEHan]|uniref:hydroxyacylglutathione hydrolase n=1 Tax=Acidithiobacillus sp. AMEEHan TaxID=2994951 RepID=UPI0027E3C6B8|nr:hydroxyacylglutathione hydrolase [Acidithiobacillus sp. AMEEHan]
MLTLIPAFQDNYIYLVATAHGLWIVDPGDAQPVLNYLDSQQLRPTAILCTHHHADHVGGVGALVEHYDIPVFGHGARIPQLSHPVAEGSLEIDGEAVQVLEVPGHTLDHIAYHWQDYVFCGDTLFAAGCGRIFEGDPQMMYASLQKLAALPDSTQICCAHEYTESNLRFAAAVEPERPAIEERKQQVARLRAQHRPSLPSTLQEERQSNPFLRCREADVIRAARAHGARNDSEVEVFAALRHWKDRFH